MNYPAPVYRVATPVVKSNKKNLVSVAICVVICLVIVIVIIALAVGLGVGLSLRSSSSSNSGNSDSILSEPIVTCTYNGPSTCGCAATQPSFLSSKIINGYIATANSWPWIVAIFINNNRTFCGGFLVDYQHVVTAAHCVINITPSTIVVYAGTKQLSELSSAQARTASAVVVNPDYSTSTLVNDIAVITLQSAFNQISTVGLCCLTSDTSLPKIGEHGVIAGWGVTSLTGTSTLDNLFQGVIEVQSDSSSCVSSSTSSMRFCAGYGGTGSCSGDSGSPFMTSVNNSWTCTGIVSAGTQCGQNSLYTRVSNYRQFINDNI
jgi:secreted trypsin-like serine protease